MIELLGWGESNPIYELMKANKINNKMKNTMNTMENKNMKINGVEIKASSNESLQANVEKMRKRLIEMEKLTKKLYHDQAIVCEEIWEEKNKANDEDIYLVQSRLADARVVKYYIEGRYEAIDYAAMDVFTYVKPVVKGIREKADCVEFISESRREYNKHAMKTDEGSRYACAELCGRMFSMRDIWEMSFEEFGNILEKVDNE